MIRGLCSHNSDLDSRKGGAKGPGFSSRGSGPTALFGLGFRV